MPRIRTIKPEMPSDEKLAQVSRDARLTFTYLITQADDDGLVPSSPRQLLGMLFPHDADVTEAMVLTWCHELANIGAVRWRTTRGGAPVLELVNWYQHQKIKHPAKPVLKVQLTPLSGAVLTAGEVLPTSSGGCREDGGRVSPTNQQPATMDHGPATKDRGPATSNRVAAADLLHGRLLTAAANRAIAKRFGEQPVPLVATNGTTHAALQKLEAEEVPVDFAAIAIEDIGTTGKLFAPPRSLGYFVPGVIDRWRAEQAYRDATSLVPAGHAAATEARDPNYFTAIRYAREGDAEWQAYCRDRDIAWEAA